MGITRVTGGDREVSSSSSSSHSVDREKWNKAFSGLVKLLKNRQEQLDTLVKERKTLEERIKSQHNRWVSDVRLFQDHISLMREELIEKEMALLLEAAKTELLTGLKQRGASLHKLTREKTEDELADYRALLEYLSSNQWRLEETEQSNLEATGSTAMKAEIKRQKREIDKVASNKDMEISSLLKEKSFIWNQYHILEDNLTSKLKSKENEVELANEKIFQLLTHMEILQSRSDEKDQTIERLVGRVSEMEADTDKWKQEISKLTHELELLRNSKNAQITPTLEHRNTGIRTSTNRVKSNSQDAEADNSLKHSAKSNRSLKRKKDDVVANAEIPKLFSSAFRVPKLKTTPTHFR